MKVCFLSGLKEAAGAQELALEYRGPLSGLLAALCQRYGPSMRGRLMDPGRPGARSPFLKVLVDGEDVGEEDQELRGAKTVFLFLPIAGG